MRERINSAAVRKYVFSRLREGEMVAGDLELKWALGFLETLKQEKRGDKSIAHAFTTLSFYSVSYHFSSLTLDSMLRQE